MNKRELELEARKLLKENNELLKKLIAMIEKEREEDEG